MATSFTQEVPSSLTVLVVDDHLFQRRTVCRVLRQLGCADVHEAGNGRQALDWLRTRKAGPLLILCDLEMPEADGMMLLRELRSVAPDASVAICSGQDPSVLRSVRNLAAELGIDLVAVLSKPPERIELARVMERATMRVTHPQQIPENSWVPDDIGQALDAGWVRAYYEPKIRLNDGGVCGCEILARIVHPEYGTVPPAVFIARVIGSPLELRFAECLLQQAVEVLSEMDNRIPGFSLSLNVTPSLAMNPQFCELILAMANAAGLAPERWVLEITETSAMPDNVQVAENLVRLKMRGFKLSIDDFGTGFSSLQRLLRLPFSELKLDRSFVQDLETDRTTQIVAQSIIELSQRLGLTTVAEGVENAGQLALLKNLGCNVAQGYLFARAMPPEALRTWLPQRWPPAHLSRTRSNPIGTDGR
jgi:EAL domain-containing protein (putative c-di-GMP-specific phosphodiesterase class I)/AmiR/NasT family two-component response regulator